MAAASGSAAAVRGGSAIAGGASSAHSLASAGQSGAAGVASGLAGVGRAAGSAATAPVRNSFSRAAGSVKGSFTSGARSGFATTGGSSGMGTVGGGEAANDLASDGGTASSSKAPAGLAQRMKHRQAMARGAQTAAQVLKSGDSHGGGHSVDLSGGE
jgi:type IV secretion system protein TrbL